MTHQPLTQVWRPDTVTRSEFVEALIELRTRSGQSYRGIAKAIDSYPTTVHGWINGRHLPYPRENDAFCYMLQQLGVNDTTPWLEALDRLRSNTTASDANPYLGLHPYGAEDAQRFFGRSEDQQEFTRLFADYLGNHPSHPIVVIGPSGVGKSSFTNVTLGAIAHEHGLNTVRLDATNSTTLGAMTGLLEETTTASDTTKSRNLVLIDQFEQALGGVDEQVFERVQRLCAAKVPTVLVVRSDFYDECLHHPIIAAGLRHSAFHVAPIALDSLAEVVTGPAQAFGRPVEPQLVSDITADFTEVGNERDLAGALPLLSFLLYQVADDGHDTLDSATYRQLGRLHGAIEGRAEATFHSLNTAGREAARRLFIRLADVSHGGPPTRRVVPLDDDTSPDALADDIAANAFISAGLVTATEDGLVVAHEAVLVNWRRCERWLRQHRDAFVTLHALETQAASWQQHGRSSDALIRGTQLTAAEGVLDSPLVLERASAEVRKFVAASQVNLDAQLEVERRRVRTLWVLSALAALTAAAAVVVAVRSDRLADDARLATQHAVSRELSSMSTNLSNRQPLVADHLAIAAYRVADTVESRSAVLQRSGDALVAGIVASPGSVGLSATPDGSRVAFGDLATRKIRVVKLVGTTWTETMSVDFDREIDDIALHPSGDILATGGRNAPLRVWDISGDAPTQLTLPDTASVAMGVEAIEFASHSLVAVGSGGSVVVLDIDGTHVENATTLAHDGATHTVAASADGSRIATGHDDGVIKVWSPDTAEPLTELTHRSGVAVTTLDLSPDGTRVAAGGRGPGFGLWDISDIDQPVDMATSPRDDAARATSQATSVTFDPTGSSVAMSDDNGTIQILDITDGAGPPALVSSSTTVIESAFAGPHLLVIATTAGEVLFYDIADPRLNTFASTVRSIDHDSTGRAIATTSDRLGVLVAGDGGGRTWTFTNLADVAPNGAAALSPDGAFVVVAGADGVIERRGLDGDAKAPNPDLRYDGLASPVERVLVSPDGSHLVGVSDTQFALWRVEQPDHPMALGSASELGAAGRLGPAAGWSADGDVLAIGVGDSAVMVLDVSGTGFDERARLEVADGIITAIEFHPIEPIIAVATDDGKVRLYDLADLAAPQTIGEATGGLIEGANGTVRQLDFSGDGRMLAGAASSAVVWDITDPSRPDVVARLDSGADVHTVSFDSAGTQVLAGDTAGRVSMWDLDIEEATERLCSRAIDPITDDDPITDNQWRRFVPADMPVEELCPKTTGS